jgi:hypothetical protein
MRMLQLELEFFVKLASEIREMLVQVYRNNAMKKQQFASG